MTGQQLAFDLDLDRLEARRLGRLAPAPALDPWPALRPVRVRRHRGGPKLWMLDTARNPGRARTRRHRDGWRRVETVTLRLAGVL